MTFSSGSTVQATDYNNLVGVPTGTPSNSNKALQPFINTSEASNKMAAIYGVGYGSRGYGQSTFVLPNKSSGNIIDSDEWTALRNAISLCATHQGTSVTNLVPTTDLQVGDTITAFDGNDDPNDSLSNLIPSIDTNRFNTDSGASMTLTTSAQTETRGSSWSSIIDCTVRATWTTANAARYFFNSGGEIRIRFSHPAGVTSQDSDWNSLLANKVGTIALKATSTTQTASSPAGIVTGSNGFYNLTTDYVRYYNGTNIGSGAYVANDVFIDIRAQGTAANGAPGTSIDFLITLRDDHTGAEDLVSANTQAIFDVYRATAHLSGIAAPSWSVSNTFN